MCIANLYLEPVEISSMDMVFRVYLRMQTNAQRVALNASLIRIQDEFLGNTRLDPGVQCTTPTRSLGR